MRVSRDLLERYSALGAAVRREGFVGARSALVNAVLALEGPSDLAGAAELEQAARRARAAPLVQAA